MEFPGDFWEERLARPIDIYPEHRMEGPAYLQRLDERTYRMRSAFLEVHTDAGITGLSGPISGSVARSIMSEFEDLLLGENPLSVELPGKRGRSLKHHLLIERSFVVRCLSYLHPQGDIKICSCSSFCKLWK